MPGHLHVMQLITSPYVNLYVCMYGGASCPKRSLQRVLWNASTCFFTPIPCTYTSLPLNGMARNYYYFLSTWICKMIQFVASGSIFFLPPYTWGEKKNIWSELELTPGPNASQATALTTRPWLLGHQPVGLVQKFIDIQIKPYRPSLFVKKREGKRIF